MGDGKGFESAPDDIATHGATVDKVGDRLTKLADKGGNVDLGMETYGIIGQAFSGGAREEIAQTSEAMREMGTGLSDFGEGVKSAGEHYKQVEHEITEFVKKFGG